MTSSTTSSSRSVAAALAVLASIAGGCAHDRAAGHAGIPLGVDARLGLLPLANLSGVTVPVKEIQLSLEVALRARGLDLLAGDVVEQFLARHRIRDTTGVDRSMAKAAREELGVDGLLVTTLALHGTVGVPRYGLTMRLVSAGGDPAIAWMDATARAGDDSPGLFGVGAVGSVKDLREEAHARLAASLSSFLRGMGPRVGTCPGGSRFRPRIHYHSDLLEGREKVSVAVLPFVNETRREGAGEVLTLELARQLASVARFDVLEPGIVRAELLRRRIIMQGGVSLESARLALGSMAVDMVVAGYVRTYEESPPRVEFSVLAIDTRENRLVWQSSSYGGGDDGVFLFDLGRVSTANMLACRLARALVDEMLEPAGSGRRAAVPVPGPPGPRTAGPSADGS
jgi:TolB-like protein